jgi:hypothetical protein
VHHLRAITDAAAENDHPQLATALANHALNRLDAGDVHRASEQVAQAQHILTTYEMAGSSAGFAATLRAQCARVHSGRYGAALDWCDRAESFLAERNPARLPVARLHRAHVWLDLGQHARALQVLDGPELAAARELPARFAVRWLLLLARVKRRLGARQADAGGVLAGRSGQRWRPPNGWPELALLVRTEQALAQEPAAALAQLQTVAAEARARKLHAAELGALLHATALAAGARAGAGIATRAGRHGPGGRCRGPACRPRAALAGACAGTGRHARAASQRLGAGRSGMVAQHGVGPRGGRIC